jgi:hypothetical protein
LGAGADFRAAGSNAADSLFFVALCTDILRESLSTQFCCTAIQTLSRPSNDRRRACKILMQIGISRVGLDHILEATGDQTEVGAGRELAKVRTTSQLRAKSAGPQGGRGRAGP